MAKPMLRTYTPELLWHGGGNEHGKPDPVFAIDICPNNILATAGIDASVPPRGSVRLWRIDSRNDGQEFIADLSDHERAVNAVRFSPCGRYLASASAGQIYIYCVHSMDAWQNAGETRLDRLWVRPSLDEIYDLQWSPDSTQIIVGSIDSNAQIIRLATSVHNPSPPLSLNGHTSYVQGVAWDPLNQLVATQSADRSVRFHHFNKSKAANVKLTIRKSEQVKMLNPLVNKGGPVMIMSDGAEPSTPQTHAKGKNLFADSTVPSFFRRPTFSPDGSLFVAPTGVFRPTVGKDLPPPSFCTHIFSRDHFSSPVISLSGLEEPSIAVKFSPVPYKMVRLAGEKTPTALIPGEYRFVFAVVTVSSVLVYDTQHPHPIARIGGLHWACINDAAWSSDGLLLTVCSSDGYITFIRFAEGAFGTPLEVHEVPDIVKKTYPAIYTPADIPAVNPHIQARNNSSVSTVQPPSAEVRSSEGENNAVPSESDSAKKKKRITPQLLTSPAVVELLEGMSSEDPSLPAPAEPLKVKKRIAPTLLSSSVPATNSSTTPSETKAQQVEIADLTVDDEEVPMDVQ